MVMIHYDSQILSISPIVAADQYEKQKTIIAGKTVISTVCSGYYYRDIYYFPFSAFQPLNISSKIFFLISLISFLELKNGSKDKSVIHDRM